MKAPTWFWVWMAVWLVFGLPGYILGSLWKGSPIPDLPPIFYSLHPLDQTVGTLIWALLLPVVFAPVFAIPALVLWHRKMQKRSDAPD